MSPSLIPDDIRNWMREELFDQVPVSISVIDREYRIVEANFSFAEVYGDWEGRPCHEAYKGRDTKCHNCGAAETFEDGQIREREEVGKNRNGMPSYYIVQIIPLIRPDGSIPYVIEMSTDITPVKELERKKLEAERLAVVGQTVAGLAHGIKNIIMGLEGGMYVVRSGLSKNNEERVLRGWQMLENDIDRISSFAKEFLEFARGRTPKVAVVEPNAIAQQVIDLYI
ncbi:PAS domain-containing protein [Candidatus Bipolaricaulota bacterium]|nr:PAS domain-containing protein [Candidatus Bipolaricaulota bacterium]